MINIETEVKTDKYELYLGDCLEVMNKLIYQGVKVDMILTDPPYGTTACKWDTIIQLEKLWDECHGIMKPNGGGGIII